MSIRQQKRNVADKRMFNAKVLETDEFLRLTPEAQTLYLHLCMNADDEGIVANANAVKAMTELDDDVMDELIATGYIIQATQTKYAITHWYVHNTIPKDRFHPSFHTDAKANIELDKKVYKLKERIFR